MTNTEIRLEAKKIIAESRGKVILISFVYLAVVILLRYLIIKLSGYDEYVNEVYEKLAAGVLDNFPPMKTPSNSAIAIAALCEIMVMTLDTGFAITMLRVSRREEFSVRDLMDGFEFFLKGLVIRIVRAVFIGAGLVLFVVPGVLAIYRYSLAIPVMYDNPDKGAIWCLRESARICSGSKMRLFRLHITFLPLAIADEIVSMFLAPVIEIWLYPYFYAACSVFYNGLVPEKMPPAEASREQPKSGEE